MEQLHPPRGHHEVLRFAMPIVNCMRTAMRSVPPTTVLFVVHGSAECPWPCWPEKPFLQSWPISFPRALQLIHCAFCLLV